ncbi:twin-arginine translocation signal domain-containing protein [Patescibacteria group bacterium]|nr:twin-arginine translocation signal domain-containing protein [Patescibacteria group bacterium]
MFKDSKPPSVPPVKKDEDKLLTRRRFLGLAGAAGAGVVAYPKAREAVLATFDRAGINERINTAKLFLEQRYKIQVETGPITAEEKRTDGLIDAEGMSLVEQCDALEKICFELDKYPFLLKRNLRRMQIHLSKTLELQSGERLNGLAGSKLYIIPGRVSFERVFHHELFHMIDLSHSESRDWNELHLPHEAQPTWYEDFLPESGHVVGYGRRNEDEDRAMIAQCLLNYPDIIYLNRRIRTDEILRAKTQVVKTQFLSWSFGAMNEQFWIDMAEGAVNDGYWDGKDTRRPTAEFIEWARRRYPDQTINPEDFRLEE